MNNKLLDAMEQIDDAYIRSAQNRLNGNTGANKNRLTARKVFLPLIAAVLNSLEMNKDTYDTISAALINPMRNKKYLREAHQVNCIQYFIVCKKPCAFFLTFFDVRIIHPPSQNHPPFYKQHQKQRLYPYRE